MLAHNFYLHLAFHSQNKPHRYNVVTCDKSEKQNVLFNTRRVCSVSMLFPHARESYFGFNLLIIQHWQQMGH